MQVIASKGDVDPLKLLYGLLLKPGDQCNFDISSLKYVLMRIHPSVGNEAHRVYSIGYEVIAIGFTRYQFY
jgi:hypothetical protein